MKSRVMMVMVLAVVLGGLPALAEVYEVDPSHTTVGFSIRHMGISSVRGHFATYQGTVDYDGHSIESVKVKGVITAESINTSNEKRDDHLRAEEFFHVEKYPELTFESTTVVKKDNGYVMKGNFTMHGVTRPVSMTMTLEGPIQDPWKNQRIGMALSGTLDRHDFGLRADGPTDKLIGKEVKLEINLEATATPLEE